MKSNRVLILVLVVLGLLWAPLASSDTYCNYNSQGTCCKCRQITPYITSCSSELMGWAITACVQLEFGCDELDQTPCFAGWCDPYYSPGC